MRALVLPVLLAVVALGGMPSIGWGYRELAACPDFAPLRPAAVAARDARQCRRAVVRAGRVYVRRLLRAQGRCLDRIVAGRLEGDHRRLCLGHRRLSTGELDLPTDLETARGVEEARARAMRILERGCDDGAVAGLGLCGEDVASLAACLFADHWDEAQILLDVVYGEPEPASRRAARCQARLARAGANFLVRQHRAMARCLQARRPGDGDEHLAVECIGEVRGGAFLAPSDRLAAARMERAGDELGRKLAQYCDEADLGELDSCGVDASSLSECLLCAHRRQAMYLVQGEVGGAADRATAHFIPWPELRNPVLGLPDRRMKDQAMAFHDGWFYVFVSQSFADDDPNPGTKYYFRSRDFRTWEAIPETIHPPGGGIGSPDLVKIGDLWHLTFQNPDPGMPANRRLYHATSSDLLSWSEPRELAPDMLAGESIIDGALARKDGFFFVVFKWRGPQLPYFSRSADRALDQRWLPAMRFVAGDPDVNFGLGEGFAENFQLPVIDGQIRLLATARDRDGLRCPNLFTCWHEPFLYTLAHGDGSAVEDWLEWNHRTQLRIPYEDWNTVMHANTGFLADWRAYDGFFYLSYSGSIDTEFQGRGHGKIGLARSRDLVHWRVPPDPRD